MPDLSAASLYVVTYPTPSGRRVEPVEQDRAFSVGVERAREHGEARVEIDGRVVALHFAAHGGVHA